MRQVLLLATLMLFAAGSPLSAQTLEDRFNACLENREKDELDCAIELSPADIQSEIAAEAARVRTELGPRPTSAVRPDYTALIPAVLKVASSRATKLIPVAPKERVHELRLIAETGHVYARVSQALMTVSIRTREHKELMADWKDGGVPALDATEKLALEIIELTSLAQLELRKAVARRAIMSMRGECGDERACIDFAKDFLVNDSMRWGLNRDDVLHHLRESAHIDLLYLLEALESRT